MTSFHARTDGQPNSYFPPSPLAIYYGFFYFLSTKNGMYEEQCGLENVLMSWGHDGNGNMTLYISKCIRELADCKLPTNLKDL